MMSSVLNTVVSQPSAETRPTADDSNSDTESDNEWNDFKRMIRMIVT